MNFHIITIFPESIKGYFESSILRRAQEKKIIKIKFYNPRNFTKAKHKTIDDRPYGGGPGMVMRVEPIIKSVQLAKSKIKSQKSKIIILSAAGKQFNQKIARHWAQKYKDIILISGHYEGIDARLKSVLRSMGYVLQEISIGPYILTGGELPAAIIIDAVSRHIPGVLGKKQSLEDERGMGIPVYTRPEVFEYPPSGGKKYRVPKILLSGHHKRVEEWRKKHSKN
ncbi:MAG: tRNA (guanosine(37)-N1)-methyltransferase TrmD [Patescibacteria group bacterium]